MAKKKRAKPKNCNCVAEVNKSLEKEGSNSRLISSLIFNLTTGEAEVRVKLAMEKADSKKRERIKPLLPNYCPICGKKYRS